MAVDPISAGIQAGTAIAGTVASIIDQTKRRQFEQTLSLLTNEQQQQLNQQLLAVNDDNARMQILTNAVANIRISGVNAVGKSETTKLVVIAGSAVMVLGMMVYLYKN